MPLNFQLAVDTPAARREREKKERDARALAVQAQLVNMGITDPGTINRAVSGYLETGIPVIPTTEEARTITGPKIDTTNDMGVPVTQFPTTEVDISPVTLGKQPLTQPQAFTIYYDAHTGKELRREPTIGDTNKYIPVREPTAGSESRAKDLEAVLGALKNKVWDQNGYLQDIKTRKDAVGVALRGNIDPEQHPEVKALIESYPEEEVEAEQHGFWSRVKETGRDVAGAVSGGVKKIKEAVSVTKEYKTKEEVRDALRNGRISKEEALKILREQFEME